ncbi:MULTISPECIES: hypothetical protein [Actinosynnema]|uniref:hypothetical protein n=1 Tax=Actinosynnema TaxID=40566 RepID=UPI0020A23FC5|nr:hypothetical protein [Actinosynnema pretiosum]MCP2097272.1 hypothetical protein [Actinosynnema pretiosum]
MESDTAMTLSDKAARPDKPRRGEGVREAARRLTVLLFPFLPGPARLGAAALAVATIVATALAWAGALGGAGISSGLTRPVPVFAALTLTGATIAAACLPRYAYHWCQARNWPDGPAVTFLVVGAHVFLLALQNALLNRAAEGSAVLAGVSAVGALLWVVHEALRAYAIHQRTGHDTPD